MFKSKEKEVSKSKKQAAKAAKSAKSGNTTTLISSEAEFKGSVDFAGHLELEGRVIGNVCAQGENSLVRVVHQGYIEGELKSPRAYIDGAVVGNIHVDNLELASNARIEGDVYYRELEMAKGAQINGLMIAQADKPVGVESKAAKTKPEQLADNSTAAAKF